MKFASLADAFTPAPGSAEVRAGLDLRRSFKTLLTVALAGAALVSRADDLTQIDVPAVEPAEMTYSAFDPTHTLIGERALIAALQRVAEAQTRYPAKKERKGQFHYVTGLRVDVDTPKHLLILQYGLLRRDGRDDSIGTTRTFSIGYTLTQSGDRTHIVLAFPTQAQDEVKSEVLIPTPKLWDIEGITADYQRIATVLHGPELSMNIMAQGEIESKYKPDVVLANLDRMLGHMSVGVPTGPSATSGAASAGVFVYTANGKRLPLFTKIYAYHDGSKVQYQIQLPYTLQADGSFKGSEAVTGFVPALQRITDN